jgi:hypothetical protein
MAAPDEFCPDSWPLIHCQGDEGCSHLETLNDDVREAIIHGAVSYLWRFSGRRFGLCEVTIHPCEEDCGSWSGAPVLGTPAGPFYPYLKNGNWFNAVCGRCNTGRCGHNVSTIVLPGPVHEIVEITIDGVILDEDAYRLNNIGLQRIDGNDWPAYGDDNEFTVTYMRGVPVPPDGQLAAGVLACERAKQTCGDKTCRLPKKATTVSREGVTITMPTSYESSTTGFVGLDEVDDFLRSVQEQNRSSFSVHSPDVKPFRRTW